MISMSWDLETGRYTYDLDTHWLGETPFTKSTVSVVPSPLSSHVRIPSPSTRSNLCAAGSFTRTWRNSPCIT